MTFRHIQPSRMRQSLLSLGVALASHAASAAATDILEMQTPTLSIKVIGVERTHDGLERLEYSLLNTTSQNVRISLDSNRTMVGLCGEFKESSVPLAQAKSALGGDGGGLLLKPRERLSQYLVLGEDCIREYHVVHFVGYFVVRRADGLQSTEAFGLGKVYFKPR
jgi:hypothetical protein